jgi:4'-phosphopantetheinyl transferase
MNHQRPALSPVSANVTVHVVRFDGQGDQTAWLSDADRKRAAGIRSPTACASFVGGRRVLRTLLASRLGCLAAQVPIVESPAGKPHLAGNEIEFSLSRRAPWCAVALSANCVVGVDVEPVRPFSNMHEVVAPFFPPTAQAAFATAGPKKRLNLFFRWWTRLEAAAKAAGTGLDTAASSLDGVWLESWDGVPGLAVAVAVKGAAPAAIDWHFHADCPMEE